MDSPLPSYIFIPCHCTALYPLPLYRPVSFATVYAFIPCHCIGLDPLPLYWPLSFATVLYKYGPVMRAIWSFMDLRQQYWPRQSWGQYCCRRSITPILPDILGQYLLYYMSNVYNSTVWGMVILTLFHCHITGSVPAYSTYLFPYHTTG